jgi:hypothetical protein
MKNTPPHKSVAKTQSDLQKTMIDRWLETQEMESSDWATACKILKLPDIWKKAQPDGVFFDGKRFVVVESYARIADLKSGQRRKIAMDAFKLISIKLTLKTPEKISCCIILPTDLEEAVHPTKSWLGAALNHPDLKIHYVVLTGAEKKELRECASMNAEDR